MTQWRLYLTAALVAGIVAALTTGGPAIAHGVRHAVFAHNAGKVDGKNAVGAGATANARRGKLVATSAATGRLPNDIIAKAPDSNLLDGLDSTAFLAAAGKAADAELLDGLDSASFVRGDGTVARDGAFLSAGQSLTHVTALATVQYACPATVSNPGTVSYTNLQGGLAPVWFDDGGSVTFTRAGVAPVQAATAAAGEHLTIGAVHQFGTVRAAQVDVYSVHDAGFGSCEVLIVSVTN
jgi:hypothetical protein